MKKRLVICAILSVCAATACVAGCGDKGVWEATSYYDKTVTFTGSDFRRGFEESGAWDNYGNLGDTTYKKIVEAYWDDIDWTASTPTSLFATPPANVDAVKTIVDGFHPYEKWDGLSFTVTKEDTASVTLNLPSSFSGFGWGTNLTMPLYEDNGTIQSEHSDIMGYSDLKAGYHGVGVKVDGNKRLIVEIDMSYSLGKSTVRFNLQSQLKDESDYFSTVNRASTQDASIDLISKPKDLGGGMVSAENILNISYYAEVTITDKQ